MVSEQHLILQNRLLQPAEEWQPPERGWVVGRVVEGAGYFLQRHHNRELQVAEGFACTGKNSFVVRASSLGMLRLEFFLVQPEMLNGLLTVTEGYHLELVEKNAAGRVIFFSAHDVIAKKFARLVSQPQPTSLVARAALLQFWSQLVTGVLPVPPVSGQGRSLQERFRQLVAQMPDVELATRPLRELAAQLACSERHFSRLFREEFGVALRTRQQQIRLQRARQLLASPDLKIATIAQESGYRHIGLFNLMFKKQFGMTPSAWRQKIGSVSLAWFFPTLFQFSDLFEFLTACLPIGLAG